MSSSAAYPAMTASAIPPAALFFLFSNAGNGTYAPAKPIGTPPLNPISIAAVDVNKDGFTDLVVSDNGSPFSNPAVAGSVMVYLGNGDGTFKAPTPLSGVGTAPGPACGGRPQW